MTETATPTLDCSDIDQYLGKPMVQARMTEEVANNDIRRWAQAMHYPNRIHYDNAYAAESRFGKLIAPQSFVVALDDAHGSVPACVGSIPNSHLLFGGDEWWFYGPRIASGDKVHNERIPYDYVVKETKFGGPTCFQRGDNNYYNADGELVAKQRSTGIRYKVDVGRKNMSPGPTEDPVWTDEELAQLEERKFEWIQMIRALGHGERWWDDVKVGDLLSERVIGPHSIVTLTTEWRAFPMTLWGGCHRREQDLVAMGFSAEMGLHEGDPAMELVNPELTDGAYNGPTRGHLDQRWAQYIGMPRMYGYGASMGAWVVDYLSGWAGEWGFVRHCNAQYKGPAFSGDITVMNAEIVDKMVDEEGRHLVQAKFKMTNQLGNTLCTAIAEVELPKR